MVEPTPISDAGLAELEPAAWRWHWLAGDEPDVWAYCETAVRSDEHRHAEPLYGPSLVHRLRTSEARVAEMEAALLKLKDLDFSEIYHMGADNRNGTARAEEEFDRIIRTALQGATK